jgi:hypothetical protein
MSLSWADKGMSTMPTSLLYHAFGLKRVKYIRTAYEKVSTIFHDIGGAYSLGYAFGQWLFGGGGNQAARKTCLPLPRGGEVGVTSLRSHGKRT